jgi:hypothetical protein
MKEYKTIRIDLTVWGRKPVRDYLEVANEEAKKGWKLIQVFAPAIAGYGAAKYFELIFERDIK